MVEAPLLKRLLVLVPKAPGLSPGQRFRLEQWAPRVVAHGIELDFVPFESPGLTRVLHEPGRVAEKGARVMFDFARRALPVARARQYDGVIIYREAALIGPAFYERVLDWLGIPLFLDFDDAIWHPGQISKANGLFSRLHFFGKTRTLCRLVDTVLVGNEYLGHWARDAGARSVAVLPTSIELDCYPAQPEAPTTGRFVVGWSGSISTLAHFEHARTALESLARRRPLTVRVICNEPPATPIANAENEFVKWTETGEAQALGACHVGIMPLPDDEYTRGKCGLKALQFMSVGRPVVISPVGMNSELVQSGRNGILASSTEEWVTALETLADSAVLRADLGAAGRQTIVNRYSAAVVASEFARVVRGTIDAGAVA